MIPHGPTVKTPGFDSGNRGSNPRAGAMFERSNGQYEVRISGLTQTEAFDILEEIKSYFNEVGL